MAGSSSWGFLLLGLGLGLLHALDADHVVAVSSLAAGRPGARPHGVALALRWGAGHGATLLALGAAALVIGLTIPAALSEAAEMGVGLLLIALGLWVLAPQLRQALVSRPARRGRPAGQRNTAVLVGAMHGLAGSAPVLALVPAVARGSAWLGVAYLAVFSLGVVLSMALFGALLSRALGELAARAGGRGLVLGQLATGLASIAVGCLLVVSSG